MNLPEIVISFEDLGACREFELRSEFDPTGPAIRINTRILNKMEALEAQQFVTHAIAHELYHFLEYCGRVQRSTKRSVSERRAEEFARVVLAMHE